MALEVGKAAPAFTLEDGNGQKVSLSDFAGKHVIGHSESRSSPFHTERVERLVNQTHGDMTRATTRRYRKLLAARGSC